MDQKQSDQRFNNRQLRYDQTQNHITGKSAILLQHLSTFQVYKDESYL